MNNKYSTIIRWISIILFLFVSAAIIIGICFVVKDVCSSPKDEQNEEITAESCYVVEENLKFSPPPQLGTEEETTQNIVYIYETVTVYETLWQTIVIYPDDYDALQEKANLWDEVYEDRVSYDMYLNEKFPEAFIVWNYLTGEMGLNNYVAAGIMGNLMNECGGNGLHLQPTIYGYKSQYYGICQWALIYTPEINGKPLEAQLNYLASNIEYIFDTYGYLYKKGFKYADFCALTSCKEAAVAFMEIYERPGPTTKLTRQNNACYAYSVFVR